MKIKAVFPDRRARPVRGVDLGVLKEAARQAERVLWMNGGDFVCEVTGPDFRRRLEAMPEGSEVVVMAQNSRSKRAFPTETRLDIGNEGVLFIRTDSMY